MPLLSHRLLHVDRIKGGRDAGGTTGTEKEGHISTTRLLPQSDLGFLSFTMIPARIPRFLRRLVNQHALPGEPHKLRGKCGICLCSANSFIWKSQVLVSDTICRRFSRVT